MDRSFLQAVLAEPHPAVLSAMQAGQRDGQGKANPGQTAALAAVPLRLAAGVAFAALAASPAQPATLRPSTTLTAPVVRLSDLFDDAGERASAVLGPAPPPGARIVVESGQLGAIARQFGVDWRPGSGGDRAVLDRPGRALPRDALMQALRAALVGAGAEAESEVDLPEFDPPQVPLLAQPRVSIEQLDFDRASGRFAAAALAEGAAMNPVRFNLSGRVQPTVPAVVPLHAVPSGAVLRAGDVKLARVRADLLRGEVLDTVDRAAGYTLRRPVPAGQPLLAADLTRPAAVAKGARVTMDLRAPGLQIALQGVAMAAGALGDQIPVLNPASRMLVQGEVVGPGRVAVAAGSAPIPADTQVAER